MNYDLMTRLGITLGEAPGRIGFRGLLDFLRNASPDTATYRETHPETCEQTVRVFTAEAVALTCDGLTMLRHHLLKRWGAHPRDSEPIQRPWSKPRGRRIGSGAIPLEEFNKWYYGR